MEYFVEMTTHVPAGTPEETVDDIRGREAARARELVADRRLLRLWRPPLAPGEWRTFGLFTAEDDRELDETLASMPLHVWRTDMATPLLPHPNDPHNSQGAEPAEFLTTLTLTVPEGTPEETVDDLKAREAIRARQLAEQGRLVRLWTPAEPARAVAHPGALERPRLSRPDGHVGVVAAYVWMSVDDDAADPASQRPRAGCPSMSTRGCSCRVRGRCGRWRSARRRGNAAAPQHP